MPGVGGSKRCLTPLVGLAVRDRWINKWKGCILVSVYIGAKDVLRAIALDA